MAASEDRRYASLYALSANYVLPVAVAVLEAVLTTLVGASSPLDCLSSATLPMAVLVAVEYDTDEGFVPDSDADGGSIAMSSLPCTPPWYPDWELPF